METDLILSAKDIADSGLWRLIPAIEVSRTKDTPIDFPGMMGVPITFLDKANRIPESKPLRVELGGCVFEVITLKKRLFVGDKEMYQRLVIRNLTPVCDRPVNLSKMLRDMGADVEVSVDKGVKS